MKKMIVQQYEMTDQSAAEYDCADEAMDGPDSVCVDDLILEQNRTRVLSMNIQKPIIKQGDVVSSENGSPLKKDHDGKRP